MQQIEEIKEFNKQDLLYKRVDIIIPAYNEEERIKPVIKSIISFIEDNKPDWRIIIALDGNDRTEEIIREYMKMHNYVFISRSIGRSGKGGAIKRTIPMLDSDYVILMDADGAVKLAEILRELVKISDYDFINFNRYIDGNDIPFLRWFASRGYNIFLKVLFGIDEKDTQSGYKILKTSLLKEIFNKITVQGGFFYINMFLYATKEKADSIELPIHYDHIDGSKFRVIPMVVGGFVSGIALYIRYSRIYKYIPDFVVKVYYRFFRYI